LSFDSVTKAEICFSFTDDVQTSYEYCNEVGAVLQNLGFTQNKLLKAGGIYISSGNDICPIIGVYGTSSELSFKILNLNGGSFSTCGYSGANITADTVVQKS
jgi:hypothetical protein